MRDDGQLIEELREATRGLLFVSESDHPFEVFVWGRAETTREFVRGQARAGPSATVETRGAREFFRAALSEPDWKGDAELAAARRFQALLRLLETSLADLKVYRVGSVDIKVYVAGRAPSGNFVG
ncbi:MAG TPA: nuclease A inhibitor family protein, partial [Pyrinomonadaceae bacterium]|nr:nuclease A inhibitor family protein [Pyrinomonadaceae bacterium]